MSFARDLTNTEFEKLVCEILSARGYHIVCHNVYDKRGGDVDVVCTRKADLGDSCVLGASELVVTYHVQAKKKKGIDRDDSRGVEQLIRMRGDVATFKALVSTADDFTGECKGLAEKNDVFLVNGRELAQIALGQAGEAEVVE